MPRPAAAFDLTRTVRGHGHAASGELAIRFVSAARNPHEAMELDHGRPDFHLRGGLLPRAEPSK